MGGSWNAVIIAPNKKQAIELFIECDYYNEISQEYSKATEIGTTTSRRCKVVLFRPADRD